MNFEDSFSEYRKNFSQFPKTTPREIFVGFCRLSYIVKAHEIKFPPNIKIFVIHQIKFPPNLSFHFFLVMNFRPDLFTPEHNQDRGNVRKFQGKQNKKISRYVREQML